MDDCGVMSAMTATDSGKNKFDFLAETCFLQVGRGRTYRAQRSSSAHVLESTRKHLEPYHISPQYGAYDANFEKKNICIIGFFFSL